MRSVAEAMRQRSHSGTRMTARYKASTRSPPGETVMMSPLKYLRDGLVGSAFSRFRIRPAKNDRPLIDASV